MTEHLTRQQLLSYLDGELSKAATRAADEHLHSCWTCRTALERLQEDIGAILDAQNAVLLRGVPPPPKPWPRIEPLLVAAAESGHVSWRARLSFRWSPVYATAAVVAIVGFIVFRWLTPTAVSANEVLRQVAQADAKRVATASGRFVRQRVRVTKTERRTARTTFGEIDSWRAANNAVYWRVGASDVAASDLRERYQRENVPTGLPLSAAAYQSWSRQLTAEPQAARHGNVMDVSLTAAHEPHQIDLKVRSDDWHVISMDLSFADAGFQIGEEEFAVVSRDLTPPDVLAHLEPPPPTTEERSVASASPARRLPSEPSVEPAQNVDDIEMEVLLALHQIGADLGEPIEVARGDSGSIRVNAWGASQERKNQLRELLKDRPNVQLELETPASEPGTVVELSSARAAKLTGPDERLARWFGGSQLRENFTRSVLDSGTSMLSHLYALKELAQRWTPESVSGLSSNAKNNLASMIQDHARAATADESELKLTLGPLIAEFSSKTDADTSPAHQTDWQTSALASLQTAKDTDGLMRSLLTTTNHPVVVEDALSQIQHKLGELDNSLASLRSSKP
jgi:hypothetical protein